MDPETGETLNISCMSNDELKSSNLEKQEEVEPFQSVEEALATDMEMLATYFNAIEISTCVSGAEEKAEDNATSIGHHVLKPKNPHPLQVLPYVIVSNITEMSADLDVLSCNCADEMGHNELVIVSQPSVALPSNVSKISEPETVCNETVVKPKTLQDGSSMEPLNAQENYREILGVEFASETDEIAILKDDLKSPLPEKLCSKHPKLENLSKEKSVNDNIFVLSKENDKTSFEKAHQFFQQEEGHFKDLPVAKDTMCRSTVDASYICDSASGDQDTKLKQMLSVPPNVVKGGEMKVSTPKLFITSETMEDVFFGLSDEGNDLFSQKVPENSGNNSPFGNCDLKENDLATPTSNMEQHIGLLHNSTKKEKLSGAVPRVSDVDLFGDISPVGQYNSAEEGAAARNMVAGVINLHQHHSSGVSSGNYLEASLKGTSNESKGRKASNENSSFFDSQAFQNVFTSTKITDVTAAKSLFITEIDSDSMFDKPEYFDPGTLNENIAGSRISALDLNAACKSASVAASTFGSAAASASAPTSAVATASTSAAAAAAAATASGSRSASLSMAVSAATYAPASASAFHLASSSSVTTPMPATVSSFQNEIKEPQSNFEAFVSGENEIFKMEPEESHKDAV